MKQVSPLAKGSLGKRQLLKWLAVVLFALSMGLATKMWSELSNEAHLSYLVPSGELVVDIFDQTDKRVRRTSFSARLRTHSVRLPRGRYRVELRPDGRAPVSRWIDVDGDGVAFTLSYLDD